MKILHTPICPYPDPADRRNGGFVAEVNFRLEEPGRKVFFADIAGKSPQEAIRNAIAYLSFGGRWEPEEVASLEDNSANFEQW